MATIEKPEIADKVLAFAQYFESKFKADLVRRGIVKSGDLQRGFRTEVRQTEGEYAILVYFNQYGRVIDQFAYRRGFKYRDESKILKKPTKYKWWRNSFERIFTQFVEELTAEYADEVLDKFFKALDFSDSIFK